MLYAGALAIHKQLSCLTIGVDLDHLLFALCAPADGPCVSVDVHHRRVSPVRLKDEVGFFLRHIALDQALLIDARDGVFHAQGSGEVFEDPLRRAGEPGQGLLCLEVPVEEVAGVRLGPIAVAGDACLASGFKVGEAPLVRAVAGGDLREDLVRVLGVTAGVTIGSPLCVEEMVDAFTLGFEGLLVLRVGAAVPASPD
jgi:hypothetical protein